MTLSLLFFKRGYWFGWLLLLLLGGLGDAWGQTTTLYSENAEGTSPNIFTVNDNTNLWIVGNAVNNTPNGNSALFINNSSNNTTGPTYAKNISQVSHLVTPAFTVPAGNASLVINFNWEAVGETGADYLKAYLVAGSYTPMAGTQLAAADIIATTPNLRGQSAFQAGLLTSAVTAGASYRVVFSWVNNSNGVGTNPSGVIDDILVNAKSAGPAVNVAAVSSQCAGADFNLVATNTGTQTVSGAATVNTLVPDNNTTGLTSTITLGGVGTAKITASSVVRVLLSIRHTFDSDLQVYLIDPSGTKALELTTGNGGSGDDYLNTILLTSAATPVTAGSAPFANTYSPEGTVSTAVGTNGFGVPTAALLGASIAGGWKLKVVDNVSGDVGYLNNWSLSITDASLYPTTAITPTTGQGTIGTTTYSGTDNTTATTPVSNAPAGTNTYTATTTDPSGTTATTTTTVTVKPLPTAVLSNNGPLCPGSPGTATVTLGNSAGPYNYSYTVNGGTAVSVAGATSPSTINLGAVTANQTVKITALSDATTGCTATAATLAGAAYTTTLTVNPLPTATLSNSGPVCAGSTATVNVALTGTAPWTFTYTNGSTSNTVTNTSTNPYVITTPALTANTTYSLTALTGAGCPASASVLAAATTTITVNPLPTATLSNSGPVCAGSAATATVSGPAGTYNFSYTLNGGTAVSIAAQTLPYTISLGSPTASQTVKLTALSDAATGCSATAATLAGAAYTTTLAVNQLPTATLTNSGPVCPGGTATVNVALTGTAPWTFTYTDGTTSTTVTNTSTNPFSIVTSALTANTTYSLTALAGAGCVATASALAAATTTITVNPLPTFTTTKADATCNGSSTGTITVMASGGVVGGTYEYSKNGGTTYQSSNVLSGLTAGTYQVVVRNAGGPQCAAAAQAVTIGQPSAIVITTPVATTVTCAGTSNGTITVAASGGTGTLTYSLNGSAFQASNVFSGVMNGTYTVTVKDASACTVSASATVGSNPLPTAALSNSGPVCANSTATGTATVTLGGSPGPYNFSYTINGGPAVSLTNRTSLVTIGLGTPTASQTVRITALSDANTGCAATAATLATAPYTTTYTVNPLPTAAFSASNKSVVCYNTSTTLRGTLTGTAPFTGTYSVSGGPAQALTTSGNTFSIVTGNLTASTTFAIKSLSDANSCVATTTNLPSVTIGTTTSTTWLGTVSSNWYDEANWNNCVPTSIILTLIPSSAPYAPVISSGNAAVNTLTVQGAMPLTLANASTTLTIGGNLLTFNASGFNGGTGTTVVFTPIDSPSGQPSSASSTFQTIGMGTFYNLTLGGNRNKQLTGSIFVNNNFDFGNSRLTMDDYDLTMGAGTGTFKNAGATHHLNLTGAGRLGYADLGGSRTTAFYPIGVANNSYTPATLINSGTPDVFYMSIKASVDNPVNAGAHYVNRQWDIQEGTLGGSNATLTLQWNTIDENPGFDRSNCGVAHYTTFNTSTGPRMGWVLPATSLGAATPVATGIYSRTRSGLNNFSPFAVEDYTYPLPVELTSFTAVRQGLDARLNWTTASERQNQGFEVQVSADGTNFRALGFVQGAGTSLTPRTYSFVDGESGKQGLRYYRLRQLDLDGSEHFTPTQAVDFGIAQAASLSAVPNPFTQELSLRVSATQPLADAELTLTDMLGRVVRRQPVTLPAGQSVVDLREAVTGLPTGVYLLQLPLDGRLRTVKITKE